MQALEYWKAVTSDKAGFLDRFVSLLAESGARFCVIGGQGVNAFVEPVVSLDLDLVVAAEDLTWAAQDPTRRPSKRQKDLADISRLLEAHPALRSRVPDDILSRLI